MTRAASEARSPPLPLYGRPRLPRDNRRFKTNGFFFVTVRQAAANQFMTKQMSWSHKNIRKDLIMRNVAEKLFSFVAAVTLSGVIFNAAIV